MRIHFLKVHIFAVLMVIVSLLLVSYVALIGLSVKNVVVRKDAEAKVALLRAEVAKMEREYLLRVGDITIARADSMGLTPVEKKSYAERKILVGQAY